MRHREGTGERITDGDWPSSAVAQDLMDPGIQKSLTRLAMKMHREMKALERYHEVDDLVQQANVLAFERISQFAGRSSLKTWVCSLARNKFVDMARRAAIRPGTAGDVLETSSATPPASDPILRDKAVALVTWLRDEAKIAIPHGAEVLTLLINSGANWDYVSQAMTAWTRRAWTAETVKGTVRKIKQTQKGFEFCEALGITNYEEEAA